MFEHFLLSHTPRQRNREASLRLSPWHGSHSPALRLAAEDGALVPMPGPTQLQKAQRRFQPISLSLGKDKFRNEKCLVQRFSSLMGSINISLISKPTENGPLILKFTPLPYSVFSPSMPARH